ncbi:MAG: ankyrin repeat domain-containing protein, partial [Abditibacteriota bacterium]|nr:ankyrin repeat domain-containing protein [Abditibacteriota bacterium]
MKRAVLAFAVFLFCVSLWANASDDFISLIRKGDIDGALAVETADPNLLSETGDLSLIACVEAGEKALAAAEQLIARGAGVNMSDASRNTPLCEAARSSAAYTRLFLEKGGDVAVRDAYGRTPLFRAAAEGKEDVIPLLLAAGSDAHATDTTGNSPLSVVIESDRAELLKLFLDAGADMNVPTGTDGRLPVELAMLTGKNNILEALTASGTLDYGRLNANGSHIMEAAVVSGNAEMCSLILEKGFDINAAVNTKGDRALHTASAFGREDIMGLLLDKGADIDSRNGDGDTPLMLALMSAGAVKLLAERGADVNMKNNELLSPLAAACRLPGRGEQITLLCGAGADVLAKTLEGDTPVSLAERYQPEALDILKASPSFSPAQEGLFAAVAADDAEKAKALVSADTVNAADFGGASPLFYARSAGMAALLLDNGADIALRDHDGKTALFRISASDAAEAASELVKRGADVNAADYAGQTPLFGAGAEAGKILVENGADTEHKTLKGNTPLFSASPGLIGYLAEKGADLNARNRDGETPLYFALAEKRSGAALALMGAGADAGLKDNSGAGPVFPALLCGIEPLKALLDAGASVDEKDATGRYPLITCAEKNVGADVFKAVLEKTGDPNRKDGEGFSALYYAVCTGREDMAEALLAAGAKPDDGENLFVNLFLSPETEKQAGLARMLADAGADVNHASAAGTPLLFAVWFGTGEGVQALLEKGADAKSDVRAALMAAKTGKGDVLRLLLDAGADPRARAADGTTLLMFAAKYCAPADAALLLEKGADAAEANKAGYTAMHGAVYNGSHGEMIALLAEKGAAVGMAAEGQTPLYIAAVLNKPEAVAALGKAGADLKMKVGDKKTLRELCAETGCEAAAAAL